MDIVYIDPGYGAGIDGVTCVENEEYNPINGVAFTRPAASSFNVPRLSYLLPGKVSVRFSVYLDIYSSSSLTVSFGSRSRLRISQNTVTMSLIAYPNTSVDKTVTIMSGSTKGFHHAAISMEGRWSTASSFSNYSAIMFCDFDGKRGSTSITNNASDQTKAQSYIFDSGLKFTFPSAQTDICYISNLIVAMNASLNSDMLLVKLPLKNTSGDFLSLGDGEYVGNTSGQKLLSVVDASDASDVITKFGASSKVSHLVSYGHPGYRVGANITSAAGISESDSSIAAHGSCALSTDTDASATVAWAVDNTRLSDVDGMKIGWQV